jgi:NAD(P)-dependent dehydrogenase (short-subunit alcohol dehydrogenase family)
MAVDLAGRTAIVTGSSKGIGYAIAEALARANANVVVSARNPAEVTEAARRLEALGAGKVLGIPADVSRLDDVRRLVGQTVETLGGLDVLVNNAGIGAFGAVDEFDPETWDRLIGTNLSGVFYCCHEAIPHLAKSDDAWIINIASLAGKNPFSGGAAYNASKFGLVGFSEALMMDVRQQGIRVNYIMPGSVSTYFHDNVPSEKDAWKIQPEDIAELVMDLLAFPKRSLASRIEVRPSRPPPR